MVTKFWNIHSDVAQDSKNLCSMFEECLNFRFFFKLSMLLHHNLSHIFNMAEEILIFNMAEEILIPPANHRS